eukprot:TRINITY_DN11745_c0_g1_i2.p1 TRINITY_DN11745_c0_g1~~TRINITY_DN11745_c0_g1_i2.p1  ORF type:complete len:1223 (+),score=289.37 TRINITY_DN11745_c0_g1_i2:94-3762(+)
MAAGSEGRRLERRVTEHAARFRQLTEAGACDEEVVAVLGALVESRLRLQTLQGRPAAAPGGDEQQLPKEVADLVRRYNRLAVQALHQGDLPRATAWLSRAEAIVDPQKSGTAACRADSIDSEQRKELHAATLNNLACLSRRRGRISAAVHHLRLACQLEEEAFGAPRPSTLINLAVCLTSEGSASDARECCTAAIGILHRNVTIDSATPQEQQLQGAVQSALKAVSIARQLLGAEHPTTLQAEATAGQLQASSCGSPSGSSALPELARVPSMSRRRSSRRSGRPVQPHPPLHPPPQHKPRPRRRSRGSRRTAQSAPAGGEPPPVPPGGGAALLLPTLRHGAVVTAGGNVSAASAGPSPLDSSGDAAASRASARARHRRRQKDLHEKRERRQQQREARQYAVGAKRDGGGHRKRRSRERSLAAAADATPAGEPPDGPAEAVRSQPFTPVDGRRRSSLPAVPHYPAAAAGVAVTAAALVETVSAGQGPAGGHSPARPRSLDVTEVEKSCAAQLAAATGDPASEDESPLYGGSPLVARKVVDSPLTFADLKGEAREADARRALNTQVPTSEHASDVAGAESPTRTLRQQRVDAKRQSRLQRLALENREEEIRRVEINERIRRQREAEEQALLEHLRLQERRLKAAIQIQGTFRQYAKRVHFERRQRLAMMIRGPGDTQGAVVDAAALWLRKTEGARALVRRLAAAKAIHRVDVVRKLTRCTMLLQRAFRVVGARLRVRRLRALRTIADRTKEERARRRQAATKIQALHRGRLGRRKAMWADFHQRRRCARCLWRFWVRCRARLDRVKRERERGHREEFSARLIQRRWRGFKGRLLAAERRLRRRIAGIRAREQRAAVAIQRVFRGFYGRRIARVRAELRAAERSRRAAAAAQEGHEKDDEEVRELLAEAQRLLQIADTLRAPRLAAAERWREEARQYYLEHVVTVEESRRLDRYRAVPPARVVAAQQMQQQERILGLTHYARVRLATARIQRYARRWASEMTPQRREALQDWRERNRLRRAQAELAFLIRRQEDPSVRAAAEARQLRDAHQAEMLHLIGDSSPRPCPTPAPPPRAAPPLPRPPREESRRAYREEQAELQRREMLEQLQRESREAAAQGDSEGAERALAAARAAELPAEREAREAAEREARAAAAAARRESAATDIQRVLRGSTERAVQSRRAQRRRDDSRYAREWGAARCIQGLWFMLQAREAVRSRQRALLAIL